MFGSKDRDDREPTPPAPRERPETRAGAPIAETPPAPAKEVQGEVVDVNRRLAGLARSIKSNQKKCVSAVLAIGEQLAEAKDLLADHNGGSWGKWLKDRVGMSRMTAHRMIALHEEFGGCNNVIQLADVDALRKLCGGPDAAVKKAKQMLESGERVDMRAARELLGAVKITPKKSRPEQTVIKVESGFIVCKPAREGVTPTQMIQEFLKQLRAQKEQMERAA